MGRHHCHMMSLRLTSTLSKVSSGKVFHCYARLPVPYPQSLPRRYGCCGLMTKATGKHITTVLRIA